MAPGSIISEEHQYAANLKPNEGYDLKQIFSHYMHRRRLRRNKMVLRYGDTIFLSASGEDNNNRLQDVLCFARYSLIETIIVMVNVSDKEKEFSIDFGPLLPIFKQAYSNSTVVMVRDCLESEE